jgi:hypothetical protein
MCSVTQEPFDRTSGGYNKMLRCRSARDVRLSTSHINASPVLKAQMKIENVLKNSKKSPETTGEKRDGKHKELLQKIITSYTPIGDENKPETDEKKNEEEKVASQKQDERKWTKRASPRKRHEALILELEWKVEQLSFQVQILQEQNHGLKQCVASLDNKLEKANDTIDVLSSRAVYILHRYHRLYRSMLEQLGPIEDYVSVRKGS